MNMKKLFFTLALVALVATFIDSCKKKESATPNNSTNCSTPATPTASSNTPVALGSSIQLTTPTAQGATYSWTGPNSFTSASQNPTISSATSAMSGAYSVTITVGSCPSSAGTTNVVVGSSSASCNPT